MNPAVQEPTPEQLQAMAYVDGELSPEQRRSFERLLEQRDDLRREVVSQQRLALLARSLAAPEPIDYEWRALARDPVQRGSTVLAFTALAVAALGLAGFAGYAIYASDMPTAVKWLVGLGAGGALLLFLITLRARLRTLPYDPYTEIER